MAKTEYGVWLKTNNAERLVYTDTMMACQRYTEIETAKNPGLAHKWRIGLLSKVRVSLITKTGPVIIAAFDSETDAAFYVNDFIKVNNIERSEIDIEIAA